MISRVREIADFSLKLQKDLGSGPHIPSPWVATTIVERRSNFSPEIVVIFEMTNGLDLQCVLVGSSFSLLHLLLSSDCGDHISSY